MPKQGTTTQRGYDHRHRLEKRKWQKVIDERGADCCLCGEWIPTGTPSNEWHLDHLPGTDLYRGPACVGCNTRDGARRRHATPSYRRRAL